MHTQQHCAACGHELPDWAETCPGCGLPVGRALPPEEQVEIVHLPRRRLRIRWPVVALVGIGALLVVVALFDYWFFGVLFDRFQETPTGHAVTEILAGDPNTGWVQLAEPSPPLAAAQDGEKPQANVAASTPAHIPLAAREQGGETLIFSPTGGEVIQGGDYYGASRYPSHNGRLCWLLGEWGDTGRDLRVTDFAGQERLVARDVSEVRLAADENTAYYLKNYGDLYRYSFDENREEFLASGAYNFAVSGDGSSVFATSASGAYLLVGQEQTWLDIDQSATPLYVSDDGAWYAYCVYEMYDYRESLYNIYFGSAADGDLAQVFYSEAGGSLALSWDGGDALLLCSEGAFRFKDGWLEQLHGPAWSLELVAGAALQYDSDFVKVGRYNIGGFTEFCFVAAEGSSGGGKKEFTLYQYTDGGLETLHNALAYGAYPQLSGDGETMLYHCDNELVRFTRAENSWHASILSRNCTDAQLAPDGDTVYYTENSALYMRGVNATHQVAGGVVRFYTGGANGASCVYLTGQAYGDLTGNEVHVFDGETDAVWLTGAISAISPLTGGNGTCAYLENTRLVCMLAGETTRTIEGVESFSPPYFTRSWYCEMATDIW